MTFKITTQNALDNTRQLDFFIRTNQAQIDESNYFIRALGDGSDVDNNDNTHSNASDTDAPNDTIYMISGVVIAMFLVGLIIILVAVTINKLRKREESNSATPATLESQNGFGPQHRNSSGSSSSSQQEQHIFTLNNNNINAQDQVITFTRTSGVGTNNTNNTTITNNWVFPPKAPTPNIYNCINNDALLAANDKNGFKGLRKQFSGRFKRLVAKKNEPAPAIPPELKPQLKTIYVY